MPQNPGQQAFNKLFSQVRVAVEIDYKIIKTTFKTTTCKFKSKLHHPSALRTMSHAVVIKNLRNIILGSDGLLRGNQISQYFGLDPPGLLEYVDTSDLN